MKEICCNNYVFLNANEISLIIDYNDNNYYQYTGTK